jgi:hypothetical protein
MCIIGYDSLGNTAEFLLLEDYYLNPQIKIDNHEEFTSASSTSPIDASKATCTKEDTRYTPQYTLSERIKIPISCYSNSQNESQSFTCSACGSTSTCQKCFSRDNSMRHKDITSERLKEMKVNGNY